MINAIEHNGPDLPGGAKAHYTGALQGANGMGKLWAVVACVVAIWCGMAAAQDSDARVWIQVEAQPSLTSATNRARAYAAVVPDVNGFSLGGGWYGVALGPYPREEADRLLREYRSARLIPGDSFIAFTRAYRNQFWPAGTDLLNDSAPAQAPATAPAQTETAEETAETQPQAPAPAPEPVAVPDETPREARASEARLSRDDKKLLQVALKWAGFYTGAIDGAYGRGTRGAMAAWQTANAHEATGVLTTAQRAELLGQYNAVLKGMGLTEITDDRAGIRMQIPTGVVAFNGYEYPFALYNARSDDLAAQVLLISQRGGRDTLHGLYDIMETLEIVPLEGPREKRRDTFTLTGANDRIVSYTEARLVRGEVKGFTLIWPAGDEERRTRILDEMRASFRVLPGSTLARTDSTAEDQSVDLISGLKLRKPKFSRTGFWTDSSGTVLTSAAAVDGCGRITLDTDHIAKVQARDTGLGIAVLTPEERLAPPATVAFRDGAPRLKSEVAVSGFSYEGQLGAPTLTFGTLEALSGLNGEAGLRRLSLSALPGDAGGPVFDTGGAVVGLLLPPDTGTARRLPDGVAFAAAAPALRALLQEAGTDPGFAVGEQSMAPEDLTMMARDVTVLVNCWE